MKQKELTQQKVERMKAMFEMSQKGLTYAQIGAHFGVGAQRVGELVRTYSHRSQYPKTELESELSTRTANCLKAYKFDTKEQIREAWEAGYDFTAISNLGRNSLEEIREWLGYPQDKPFTPDWSEAPPDATWASFDSQGNVHWYTEKPRLNKRP